MRKTCGLLAAVMVGMRLSSAASADETADAIEKLKQQIQELSQKVNDLEARQKATAAQQATVTEAQKTEAEERKKAPFITAGADGFSLQSANTNFILKLHGFGQVDSHYYASPAVGAKDTFAIRRLRAIASGTVYRDYDYYVQTDFASGITSTTTNNSFLQDAYLNFHYFPEFQVQAGKFKEPVSLEILPLDEYLWFLERGLPTELAPNRDVGVEVHGDLFGGVLNYAVGAFNGVPDGGSGDVEVADNDKDAVARIFVMPLKNSAFEPLKGFGFGLGSSYGLQAGSTTPTFATVGRQTFFKYNSTVSETGQHLRLDPQGYYFWGPFGLYGEYVISDEKFHLSGKTPQSAYYDNRGWDVVGSYFLTGEENRWATLPMVDHPFHIDGSGWGAFQLAARIGQLSLDQAAFPLYAASGSASGATSWSIALNWYLNRNIKCIFEYSQTSFDGGSKASGALTAQDEKALLGRLQFGF
jgi:phosphate-selective porin OprO/OprP